jgi:hypothetical protein
MMTKANELQTGWLIRGTIAACAILGVCWEGSCGVAEGWTKKTLLVDPSVIEWSRNVVVDIGGVEKYVGNPLFGEQYPWEPRFDNMYPNVMFDVNEGIYKCWYSPFVICSADDANSTEKRIRWRHRESGVCYATSKDGIHWEKPLLAEFPFKGEPSNLIFHDAHGAGVFKDYAEKDDARRYKMIFQAEENGNAVGMAVAFSRDGIHWSRRQRLEDVRLAADTHNNAIWAPSLDKYVAISRDWQRSQQGGGKGIRLVARMTSDDFVHWSEPKTVLAGTADDLQTYAMPIFWYEGLYFGLPAIFDVGEDRVHVELAWSKDTVKWIRVAPGKPLIGNGERFDWGCVFAAASPIVTTNGIRLYYAASDGRHGGLRRGSLALAILRPDAFGGLRDLDDKAEGEFVTKPMEGIDVISSKNIHLTADIASGGRIEVMILDPENGQVIARSAVIEGERNLTSFPVELRMCGVASGRRVKVKMVFKRAMIYSFER